METINREHCVKAGYIQKTHGVKGELVIRFEEEFYEAVEESSVLFLEIDGLLVPFFPEEDGIRHKSAQTLIVKFDWIDDEQKARELIGTAVYVNEECVPEAEEVTPSQLMRFKVFDQQKEEIGPITAVNDYAGNVLLSVSYRGNEVLIPFNHELLVEVDEENHILYLNIPEGLLELDD